MTTYRRHNLLTYSGANLLSAIFSAVKTSCFYDVVVCPCARPSVRLSVCFLCWQSVASCVFYKKPALSLRRSDCLVWSVAQCMDWNTRRFSAHFQPSWFSFSICSGPVQSPDRPKLFISFLTLYSAKAVIVPHRITWSWYTGRWWVGCYIWYSEEGTGRGRSPPRPLLAVPNITAHPSMASVPIIVLLCSGPLLCGFNAPITGLRPPHRVFLGHPLCRLISSPSIDVQCLIQSVLSLRSTCLNYFKSALVNYDTY